MHGMEVAALNSAEGVGRSVDTESSVESSGFEHMRSVLISHCYDCHGGFLKESGLDLVQYENTEQMIADREVWERVVESLDFRLMPPEDGNALDPEVREELSEWIESTIHPVDYENPDPGYVVMRRLNRQEYRNTLRDLLGVDYNPTEDFPVDDTGYGFDTIGEVLSLSPSLLEKYLASAEVVLNQAITISPAADRKRLISAKRFYGGRYLENEDLRLLSGEENHKRASLRYRFNHGGDYRIRLLAVGDQAGDQSVKMDFRFNRQHPKRFSIHAEKGSTPQVCELYVQVKAREPIQLTVEFLNDYFNPTAYNEARRDRNLYIAGLEIEGPINPPPVQLGEVHKRILGMKPTGGDVRVYVNQVLERFASRAYRRVVTESELDRLYALVDLALQQGEPLEVGFQQAMKAILVSPHFIYRHEYQPAPDDETQVHDIDEFSLASRLSYFIWSSMPDYELFQHAQKGTLRANLEAQVRRMLRDPKAGALAENFGGQWLQFRNVHDIHPDPDTFPEFDETLRQAMLKETELFFKNIHWEDHSVLEFIDADFTFLNERLAQHYGFQGVVGEHFRKVNTQNSVRGGLLTHASVLAVASNPTRTSPVLRGKWLLENILGKTAPHAPDNVPDLSSTEEAVQAGNLRQRLEAHSTDPTCASCHRVMDPMGFALENFDALGRYRLKEGPFPIDSSGRLYTGEEIKDYNDLRAILVNEKRDDFVRCVAEKMLTFALGRGLEYYDKPAVESIVKRMEENEYRFSSLVLGVVESVPFQKRRGSGREELAMKEWKR